ncbi:MAG: type IV secretion system protein [Rhodospirillales bacterium]|nr:type IV secretion system protein [Rhodospirillales bacterium]
MLAVMSVVVWLFWYYQSDEVRNIIRWIRYAEAWVLQWFILAGETIGLIESPYKVFIFGREISFWDILNGNEEIVRQQLARGEIATPQRSLYFGMANYNKAALTINHLELFTAATMGPMRIAIVTFVGLGALWCIFKGPQTHYRSRLGLEGLIHRQSKNFPVIAPFADFNPSTQPPRPPGSPVPAELPAFAEALGPEEWLAYNNIPAPDGKIDEEVATKAFMRQLYGRWKGPLALKPYQQVLLAAFCLKASRKRGESDDMLGRLAMCWSHKNGLQLSRDKFLLKEARKILKNKDLSTSTLSKCNQHAFVTTALLRALATAREEGGVLAPAQFVWLRGHDRTLWYPLNNLGRQSYHLEAIGAMSHYKAEKMTQRPIPVPKLADAVETISEYMGSRRARPIPQLDYSKSSKRGVKKAI